MAILTDVRPFSLVARNAPLVAGRHRPFDPSTYTLPFFRASGGELVYPGAGGDYFVGPQDEGWDLAMSIRQDSVQSFLAFATNDEYLAGIGHRTAAVLDSRILPLVDIN